MMHLKPSKNGVADISEFSGYISTKQNISIISVTKLVLVISVLLAVLMIVSK
jgi:hypothetical protein